jgi:excisionase family DNA binding protein
MAKKKTSNSATDRRLTVATAAEDMGCSAQTVRRLCHAGKLEGWKIERVMVVSAASVEAYLKQHKIGGK